MKFSIFYFIGKASCGNDPNFKNFCTNWASVGYCEKTSSYHDWMGKKCKKSCGLCDKGTLTYSIYRFAASNIVDLFHAVEAFFSSK